MPASDTKDQIRPLGRPPTPHEYPFLELTLPLEWQSVHGASRHAERPSSLRLRLQRTAHVARVGALGIAGYGAGVEHAGWGVFRVFVARER